MLTGFLLALALQAAPAPAAAERVVVTVLATTDTHGHLLPYDYFTRQPSARGLAAVATLVEAVRRETKNTLARRLRRHDPGLAARERLRGRRGARAGRARRSR